ncbi:MAG: hypothetical protein ACRYGP_17605 [Janthinobacterium lividum]
MMLTGRQIREARALLGLNRSVLATKIGRITTLVIMRAEENEDEPILSAEHDAELRRGLERLGVEIGPEGVRLRVTDREASKVGTGLGYVPAANASDTPV